MLVWRLCSVTIGAIAVGAAMAQSGANVGGWCGLAGIVLIYTSAELRNT